MLLGGCFQEVLGALLNFGNIIKTVKTEIAYF